MGHFPLSFQLIAPFPYSCFKAVLELHSLNVQRHFAAPQQNWVCICKHCLSFLRFSKALRSFWKYYPQPLHLGRVIIHLILWDLLNHRTEVPNDCAISICLLLLTQKFRASCGGKCFYHNFYLTVIHLLSFLFQLSLGPKDAKQRADDINTTMIIMNWLCELNSLLGLALILCVWYSPAPPGFWIYQLSSVAPADPPQEQNITMTEITDWARRGPKCDVNI